MENNSQETIYTQNNLRHSKMIVANDKYSFDGAFKMKGLFFTIFILTTIRGISQEYLYDANGNLSGDANKQVAYIHHNILNQPDTIVYDDGRTIAYTYTALGQKLSQHVFTSNGTLLHKRDYIDAFQYRNDTLRAIRHPEGRVIPAFAGNTASWKYQYHMTDHLGNVRNTITSELDTIEYFATMETESAEREQPIFKGVNKNRVSFVAANKTVKGNEVVQLMSDEQSDVVSMNLAVQRGDVIYMQVHAYYEGGEPMRAHNAVSNLSKIVLPIITGGLNGASAGIEGSRALLSPTNAAGALTVSFEDKRVPKAHLNYQVFDQEYKVVDAGFAAVTEQASFNRELLTLGPVKIQRSGYMYVYLSNSSEENIPVYYDDFQVNHIPTPIVQEDSYDPFGMTLPEQHAERFGEESNNYLFNSNEWQDDFALNWYDYGARMYDASLGRWNVTDPEAEKNIEWTPYQYVMNNPLKFIDPNGKNAELIINDKDKTVTVKANYYHSDNSDELQSGLDVWNDFSGQEKIKIGQIEYKLNFELKAVKVANREVDAKRIRDRIGNSFRVVEKLRTEKDAEAGGVTYGSNVINIRQKIFDDRRLNVKSHLLVAHEIGHTIIGLDQMKHEHTPSSVMHENNGFDLTNKLDNVIVNRILITFGQATAKDITPAPAAKPADSKVFGSNNFWTKHIK